MIRGRPPRGHTIRQQRWPSLLAIATTAALVVAVSVQSAVAACHIAAFESTNPSVEESAGQITLTVVLQGRQPSCEGTVDFATADGSATAGTDYTARSGTLTYEQGDDREETITVPILDDEAPEDSEDFTVTLSNPTGSISGTGGPATVTIADDDEATPSPSPETASPGPSSPSPSPPAASPAPASPSPGDPTEPRGATSPSPDPAPATEDEEEAAGTDATDENGETGGSGEAGENGDEAGASPSPASPSPAGTSPSPREPTSPEPTGTPTGTPTAAATVAAEDGGGGVGVMAGLVVLALALALGGATWVRSRA